jgi:large subunit ribosomal protein L15
MPDDLNLSNLKPAQARKNRKRVGRGLGSGKGRYSGRGLKGQKSRSGSHKMRAGFEGGQNPLYMRLGKQRGGSKDAMAVGPHRTSTVPLNVASLEERFDAGAEVTLDALVEKGLIRNTRTDVKLLGQGDLTKKLSVTVHAASATAREKVEAAGGSLTLLKEPKERRPKRRPQQARPAGADVEDTEDELEAPAEAEPEPAAEAETEAEPEATETEGEEG